MASRRGHLCWSLLLCASTAWGASRLPPTAPRSGYGWMPDFQELYLRAGADFYNSGSNYPSDGIIDPLPSSTSLKQFKFWVEPEYGLAQDWSVKLKLGYADASTSDASGTLLSGSGIDDIQGQVKWGIKTTEPTITLGLAVRAPTASSRQSATSDLVLGNGSFDTALQFHGGYHAGIFGFALTPAIMFRSRGYSHAITVDGAVQVEFSRGYGRLFGEFHGSLSDLTPTGAPNGTNSAAGSGGSFSRLTLSPTGFNAGAKAGVKLFGEFYVEAGASMTVLGTRYPNFFNVQVAIFNAWDFFKPDKRPKLREIPFETNTDDLKKKEGDEE